MDDNKQLVEARIKEELVSYFGNDNVACSRAETTNVDINILCQWELTIQEEIERRVGLHNIGEMLPSVEEAENAARDYINQIRKGKHQAHNNTLLDNLRNNRLEAVWETSIALEDDRQISCVENCLPCNGNGRVICESCGGRGKVSCPSCGGSCKNRCGGCSGSGTTYDYVTKGRKTCSSCFGSGTETCRSCYGGFVSCYTCNGSGNLLCTTCNGTGRFTFTIIFTVKAVQKQRDITFPSETPDWIRSYLKQAWEDRRNHLLPPEVTIDIHPPGINFEIEHPFKLNAPGTLVATRATFSGADERESQCEFFGEKLHSLNLGMVGETASSELAKQVLDNKTDLEKLQPLLQQKIFGILLPLRKNDSSDIKISYPFRINLLSEEAGNNLLNAYGAVVNFYKTARSNLSTKSWLKLSLVWMLVLYVFLVQINSVFVGQLDWSEAGYAAHYYWQEIWEKAQSENTRGEPTVSYFISFVATQSSDFKMRSLLCILFGIGLSKMFFLAQRALTFGRFVLEVMIGACVGCVIFLLFQPAFLRVSASTVTTVLPALNELIAGGLMSLSMVLEVVVLGLFAGLFHSRRKMDRYLRQQIKKNSITELEEDLGYLKINTKTNETVTKAV